VSRVGTGVEISGGISFPYRDGDVIDMVRSLSKRIGSQRPNTHPQVKYLLPRFIDHLLNLNFRPLPPGTDLSLETWLEHTTYTASEKQKFRELDNKIGGLFKRKYLASKCFMKEEFYALLDKEARGIFSRSDEVKILIGPIIKQIENIQYQNKNFIKHIPVSDRPRHIFEHLDKNGEVGESDYTAFESHFDKELMNVLDFKFYNYMTQYLVDQNKHIVNQFDDINALYFRDLFVELPASRLSGEMTTSSFNGFANFAMLQFVGCYAQKYFITTGKQLTSFDDINFELTSDEIFDYRINCVIEGDDGLARYWFGLPCENLYTEAGLKMKLTKHESINTASFCGIVFGEDTLEALTDVTKHLIKTGWLASRYVGASKSKRMMLVRAKAFSLAHQFPNCPVLRHYADYILRHTSKYHKGMDDYIKNKIGFLNRFEKEMYMTYANKNLPPAPKISDESRHIIETQFNLPVETQLELERYFETTNVLQEIPLNIVIDIIPKDCLEYTENYVVSVDESMKDPYFIDLNLQSHNIEDIVPGQFLGVLTEMYNKTST
jgi:hypothetical protein